MVGARQDGARRDKGIMSILFVLLTFLVIMWITYKKRAQSICRPSDSAAQDVSAVLTSGQEFQISQSWSVNAEHSAPDSHRDL
jgi:hypothetical protein